MQFPLTFAVVLIAVAMIVLIWSRSPQAASVSASPPAISPDLVVTLKTEEATHVYRRVFLWGSAEVDRKSWYRGDRRFGLLTVSQSDGKYILLRHDALPEQWIPPHMVADLRLFIAEVEARDREVVEALNER